MKQDGMGGLILHLELIKSDPAIRWQWWVTGICRTNRAVNKRDWLDFVPIKPVFAGIWDSNKRRAYTRLRLKFAYGPYFCYRRTPRMAIASINDDSFLAQTALMRV